jgi:hypothetical protein
MESLSQSEALTSCHEPFLQYAKVPACAASLQNDHRQFLPAPAARQFPARHARLRDLEAHASGAPDIADANYGLVQAAD